MFYLKLSGWFSVPFAGETGEEGREGVGGKPGDKTSTRERKAWCRPEPGGGFTFPNQPRAPSDSGKFKGEAEVPNPPTLQQEKL